MSTTGLSQNHETDPSTRDDDSSSKKQQAQQTAGVAKDEGKRVAGVAKDEGKRVAGEAKNQVRGLLDEATSQVDAQSKQQKTKLAETVRTFGDDLHSMTGQDQSSGMAAQLVQQIADQASTLASHLEDRDPRDLLDDLRSFARRRPGAFLFGALAAGVVAGRLTRGAQAAKTESSSDSSGPQTSSLQHTAPTSVGGRPSNGGTPSLGEDSTSTFESRSLGSPGVEPTDGGIVGPGGGRV